MMRAPHERVSIVLRDKSVAVAAICGGSMGQGNQQFESEIAAEEKYEEMKMIAAVDYGFHIFMENVDEEE